MSSSPPELPKVVRPTPKRFRRVAIRGRRNRLRRTFPKYFADTTTSVLGAAPKYILKSDSPCDPQYIVKYSEKHGTRETLTEYFTNQLGAALNLHIAHSGLIRSDGELTFVTQIFIKDDEKLTHGSLIIEDCFKKDATVDANELERIRHKAEQEFYSIDFVEDVLRNFCGKDFDDIFPAFIEMLVFDCLVGSMDRHSQNWGVLAKTKGPTTYRFAPIFDTARSLLWSLDESKIEELSGEDSTKPRRKEVCHEALLRHIDKAKPCIGPVRNHPKVNKCNHFDFVANLMELYPTETAAAIRKVTTKVETKSARLLRQFPFRMGFTGKRRRLILKILAIRADRLREILKKGEPRHENVVEASLQTATANSAGVV